MYFRLWEEAGVHGVSLQQANSTQKGPSRVWNQGLPHCTIMQLYLKSKDWKHSGHESWKCLFWRVFHVTKLLLNILAQLRGHNWRPEETNCSTDGNKIWQNCTKEMVTLPSFAFFFFASQWTLPFLASFLSKCGLVLIGTPSSRITCLSVTVSFWRTDLTFTKLMQKGPICPLISLVFENLKSKVLGWSHTWLLSL